MSNNKKLHIIEMKNGKVGVKVGDYWNASFDNGNGLITKYKLKITKIENEGIEVEYKKGNGKEILEMYIPTPNMDWKFIRKTSPYSSTNKTKRGGNRRKKRRTQRRY